MSVLPETLVTRSADGTNLAYFVLGSGPPYLVFPTPTQYGVPDIYWDEPGYRRTLTRLASFSRLIMPDPRGLGASEGDARERRAPGEVSDADLIAVLDGATPSRPFSSGTASAVLTRFTSPPLIPSGWTLSS